MPTLETKPAPASGLGNEVALPLPEEPVFSPPPRECSSEPEPELEPDPKTKTKTKRSAAAETADLPLVLLDFALHIGEDEVTVEVERDAEKTMRCRLKEKKKKLEAGTASGTGGSRLRRSPILRSSGNRKRFAGCVNQPNLPPNKFNFSAANLKLKTTIRCCYGGDDDSEKENIPPWKDRRVEFSIDL